MILRLHNFNHKPIIPLHPVCKNSKKQNLGWVKINVDATVSNGRMGFGVIARDDEGFVVDGYGGSKESTLNSEWAELLALEEGVQLARKLKLQRLVFESDNASIVNKIGRNGQDITILGQRAYDTCMQLKTFEAADVTWAPRSCNKIADFICNFVLNNNCSWDFDVNYP
ncbi:hypothetical protein PVK06_026213 [Gossypium arboreum]|uniref:RNase H type-1 domain-containing protein n=1 Tax=Gossypium arboreum TaxID=29729 RepID=A0ABR0P0I7_GOSAR|nr:hypothetical protein PVK06_026213 [Gossypium arboreum]